MKDIKKKLVKQVKRSRPSLAQEIKDMPMKDFRAADHWAGAQDHEQCLDQVRPQDQNRWTRAASSKPQGAEPQAASCKQQASHNELISVI
jgi:hypothetical protein